MYFSPPGCFRLGVREWEGLYAPTPSPRFQDVGPALVAGPVSKSSSGGHTAGPPLDKLWAFSLSKRPPYNGCSDKGRASQWRRGFTLLELLVVIGVIAVLGGLVLGAGRHAAESGRSAHARAELTALSAALDAYKLAEGDYPRTNHPAQLLQALIGKRGPNGQPRNGPPLIEAARFQTEGALDPFSNEAAELIDPWGRPYRYAFKSQVPWSNPVYVLYSSGPDGADTPTLTAGGFPDPSAPGNADNIHANQP